MIKAMTDIKTVNPYGSLHWNLVKALCKELKTRHMLFTFYIACREHSTKDNGDPWQFILADIAINCDIHRTFAKGMCAAFVKAKVDPILWTGKRRN